MLASDPPKSVTLASDAPESAHATEAMRFDR